MLAFSTIIALAAISAASAGLITPNPLVRAYAGYATPIIRPAATSLVLSRGSGYEGQYVPNHVARLYDDGSYKQQLNQVPLAASPYGLVPAGSGLEGQYVPDNLDKLYDDGSYRPQSSLVRLAASPYGLVPAGSGLEGQYVPDLSERLYDDGSYKQGHVVA